MRKSVPVALVGLLIVAIGIAGCVLSLFMAQNAVGNLIVSPYVSLGLFTLVMIAGWSLFIIFIQKEKDDEDNRKLDAVESVYRYAKVWAKNHGYTPSRQTIDDIFESALKCQERKAVTINGEEKAKK